MQYQSSAAILSRGLENPHFYQKCMVCIIFISISGFLHILADSFIIAESHNLKSEVH